jgi:hypothetical protein
MANREGLLAEWNYPVAPRESKSKLSLIDKRAAKTEADLSRWQRKFALARTKIKKLKARVKYYEKRQAACGGGKDDRN